MKYIWSNELIEMFQNSGSLFLTCPDDFKCENCPLDEKYKNTNESLCYVLMEIAKQVKLKST